MLSCLMLHMYGVSLGSKAIVHAFDGSSENNRPGSGRFSWMRDMMLRAKPGLHLRFLLMRCKVVNVLGAGGNERSTFTVVFKVLFSRDL